MSIITEFGKTVRSRIAGGRFDAQQSHKGSESRAQAPVPAEPAKKRRRPSAKRNAGSHDRIHAGATRQTGELADQGTLGAETLPRPISKSDTVLRLLIRPDGASLADLMSATSWQRHSVRGFLSGTVRKKLGLNLVSDITDSGERRYRIQSGNDADGTAPTDATGPIGLLPIPNGVDASTGTAVC